MTERHHGGPAPFQKQTGILVFMASVAVNLEQVWGEIRRVALNCGRNSDEIQLMAVSKTFSAEQVKKARAAGQRLFGENRIQEAGEKIPQLADPDLEWHLIGPLQSNKAARAVQLFNVIQTLDSTKIADRVNHFAVKFGKVTKVFVEVNIGGETHKHGVSPAQVPEMVKLIDSMEGLDLMGLMAIPPYHPEAERSRPYFRQLAEILAGVGQWRNKPLKELSMGMSHDYQIAIEEGATLLRVGTAIFGVRSP